MSSTREFSCTVVELQVRHLLDERDRIINKVRENRIREMMQKRHRKYLFFKGDHYTRQEAIAWFNSFDCSAFDPYWTIEARAGYGYSRLENILKMCTYRSPSASDRITLCAKDAALIFGENND